MFFTGITQAYLLWLSITPNKNLNPVFDLLINCISAKSAPQILSIKGDFLSLNILIIGLCNSFASSLLEKFSFVIPLPEIFLSKKL